MFSSVPKNGEVTPRVDPEMDRRPVNGSHTIARLDGTTLEWRMGERLPFKFANGKTINIRPASFVVLGMLTKIAREYYSKIIGHDAESNRLKAQLGAQKLKTTLNEISEIDKSGYDEAIKEEKRKGAIAQAIVGGDGKDEAVVESELRKLSYLAADDNGEGQFKAAQYIFLDASDDKNLLRWKEERRAPNAAELDAALSKSEYDYDFTGIEIKDLFHVYYQLNFLPAVEKKGYLNLMIP